MAPCPAEGFASVVGDHLRVNGSAKKSCAAAGPHENFAFGARADMLRACSIFYFVRKRTSVAGFVAGIRSYTRTRIVGVLAISIASWCMTQFSKDANAGRSRSGHHEPPSKSWSFVSRAI